MKARGRGVFSSVKKALALKAGGLEFDTKTHINKDQKKKRNTGLVGYIYNPNSGKQIEVYTWGSLISQISPLADFSG